MFEKLNTNGKIILPRTSIPCTACHYCVAGCPKHIVIPDIFEAMNMHIEWKDDKHDITRFLEESAGLFEAHQGAVSN